MINAPNVPPIQRKPELAGQTVVVIGGSAGIGLETARRARAEGAGVILTGRNPERLERAAAELGALSSSAFDATDAAELDRFFEHLPERIDHVLVTAGSPYYARLADLDRARARAISTSTSGCRLPSPNMPSAGYGPLGRCCSWVAPAAGDEVPACRSLRRAPPRCPP